MTFQGPLQPGLNYDSVKSATPLLHPRNERQVKAIEKQKGKFSAPYAFEVMQA